MTMTSTTPTDVMRDYFATWDAREFDAFQALLAPGIDFAGPFGTAEGPEGCRRGVEGLSEQLEGLEVLAMAADGEDVVTWFELRFRGVADPVPVANWSRVRDGLVQRVRATFDPRPLLG
jgi:hypothetical protein